MMGMTTTKLMRTNHGGARDVQRSRVYKAEAAWRDVIGNRRFTDKVACWAFIEKVERDPWFRRHYPHVYRIAIHDGRGRRSAAAWGQTHITLPLSMRSPAIVLHEIAHLASKTTGYHMQGHGWEYAATMLRLVRHFLGRDAYLRLRGTYATHGVRYKRPRKGRVLTDVERAALAARLAEYRAAKQQKDQKVAAQGGA